MKHGKRQADRARHNRPGSRTKGPSRCSERRDFVPWTGTKKVIPIVLLISIILFIMCCAGSVSVAEQEEPAKTNLPEVDERFCRYYYTGNDIQIDYIRDFYKDYDSITIYYKIGENGSWSTANPTFRDVGSYKLKYYIVGGENYNDLGDENNPKNITVEIDKSNLPEADKKTWTYYYTGNDIQIDYAREFYKDYGSVTIYYKIGENGSWSTAIPTFRDVGTYELKYYIIGDEYYNNLGEENNPESVTVKIEVDRSGWGSKISENGYDYYVLDDGTVSAEVDRNGVIWLKCNANGVSSWFGLDNTQGIFGRGSRFWTRELDANDNKEAYDQYLENLDERHRNLADLNKLRIFLIGVTKPDKTEYGDIGVELPFYVQLGDDWENPDISAVVLEEDKNETVSAQIDTVESFNQQFESINFPVSSGVYVRLLISKYSFPYAFYNYGWGERHTDNGEEYYTSPNGMSSAIVSAGGMTWVRAEFHHSSDGETSVKQIWFALDNTDNTIEPGSRLWIQTAGQGDLDFDYFSGDLLDENYTKNINADVMDFFRVGIIAPDGKEYINFDEAIHLFVQPMNNEQNEKTSLIYVTEEQDEKLSPAVITMNDPGGNITSFYDIPKLSFHYLMDPDSAYLFYHGKLIQTITASDVTSVYGETDRKVSAVTSGDGRISYAVKAGSGDYIAVNESTGALTIRNVPEDGKAYVTVTAAETDTYAKATKDVTVNISKADAVAAAVTANNRTYDGTEKPLVTVAGEPTGGKMYYAIGADANKAPANNLYSTSVPAETDAGTYCVWYKVVGDNGYIDSGAKCCTAEIKPKPIAGAAVTLDKTQLTYTGSEQSVKVTGVTVDGLSLTESDYTVTGNKGTDKGDYTVTVTGRGNFSGSASAAWKIVEKKTMTVSAENVNVTYDGQPHGITVTVTDPAGGSAVKYGTAEGTYDLDTSPAITNVMDSPLTVYFKVTTANYSDYTGSATVTIKKAAQTAPAAPSAESVTENSVTLKKTAGYQYSTDGTDWKDSNVFSGLNRDTEYTFYQRIAGDANHEPSPASAGTKIRTGNIVYTVTEGGGSEYTQKSGKGVTYKIVRTPGNELAYQKYRSTAVDGKTVSEGNLDTKSGSLILTMKGAYLDTLGEGEHSVKVSFEDGSAETTLRIKAAPKPTEEPTPKPTATPKPVPKTGDRGKPGLWIGLVLLGILGMTGIGLTAAGRRKQRKR